ncbi:MAG: bacterioferritin-associated ferredoxin [Parvularculaceae bacterium]
MFVCICNAIRDTEIAAVSADAKSVAEVFRRCGRRPQCGKCFADVARSISAAENVARDSASASAA